MRILVTGGAGFIGSHVAEAYVRAGHEVTVVDDLSTGRREYVPDGAHFVRLDIASPEFLALVRAGRFDVVNHHAAQKSVPKSVADPVADADINIRSLLGLLRAAAEGGVRRFIFSSTGGALGGGDDGHPHAEDEYPSLLSPYAISKFAGERYIAWAAPASGLRYVILRYGNVYGPRQTADGECGVVPIFMEEVLAGKPSRLFAYPDMPRGASRDYVFVRDVVEANVLALAAGDDEVLNIGSGTETYTLDLYELIAEVAGRRPGIERHPHRPGDVRRSRLDVSRALARLGWRAEVPLRRGIEETLAWLCERGPAAPVARPSDRRAEE
jgi:UDP-glucose 4-epimerase